LDEERESLKFWRDSALNKEWKYLQEKYNYKRVNQIGDYWYAIK